MHRLRVADVLCEVPNCGCWYIVFGEDVFPLDGSTLHQFWPNVGCEHVERLGPGRIHNLSEGVGAACGLHGPSQLASGDGRQREVPLGCLKIRVAQDLQRNVGIGFGFDHSVSRADVGTVEVRHRIDHGHVADRTGASSFALMQRGGDGLCSEHGRHLVGDIVVGIHRRRSSRDDRTRSRLHDAVVGRQIRTRAVLAVAGYSAPDQSRELCLYPFGR